MYNCLWCGVVCSGGKSEEWEVCVCVSHNHRHVTTQCVRSSMLDFILQVPRQCLGKVRACKGGEGLAC